MASNFIRNQSVGIIFLLISKNIYIYFKSFNELYEKSHYNILLLIFLYPTTTFFCCLLEACEHQM
jgi:hypothetical protein